MTRYIDADALKEKISYRQWDVDDDLPRDEASTRISECYVIDRMVDDMPTVDAVPVIRCKDCKRLGVANMKDKYGQPNPVPCCRRNGHIRLGIKPDDYCSRAERKEE